MKRFVAATDGSEGANRAIDVAAELAKAVGGSLHILNVAGNLSGEALDEVMRSASLEKNVGDIIDSHSRGILIAAAERARRLGALDVHTQSAWGDPAEKILEFAQSVRADAIAVGKRGQGRLAGLLLGSVSQKVVSLAPRVVIVVP
ncbi:universal stress protein [Methylocapsa polymorpha]|uniref:Universal stress protein n=1 Tax=Methylocapsa polymorpha TaxID=3080828 RepID=A0ABZ0HVG6_9HYPH|nr:universal stress protein [Methylocapsa sp. RX1]